MKKSNGKSFRVMANYSVYLESLRALSSALLSAMSLIAVRQRILDQYSLMPSGATKDNQTAFLDAVFEIMPKIEQLREDEKQYRKDYTEQINKSFQNALDYMMSYEDEDISVKNVSSFLQHLNLLLSIIKDRKKKGEESLSYDKGLYTQVLNKLDSFSDVDLVNSIKQAFQQIIEITEKPYVG